MLLSNDATAIVLTPAVYAATRAAGATPLPYLFVCAFIANAASFVLPISNPANLVVFGERMPHLTEWLRQFAAALARRRSSLTYVVLRLTQRRRAERGEHREPTSHSLLSRGGKLSGIGIAAIGVVLIGASALEHAARPADLHLRRRDDRLVLLLSRQSPMAGTEDVSWSVLPLVGGLFVMVEAW